MPRPLVYGNGSCLIQIDANYSIRDLFYPRVGQYNHLSGHKIRMGVWVDHRFAWCDDEGWSRTFAYEDSTLVGKIHLAHSGLGVEIDIQEAMDPVHPVYLRHLTVKNTDGHDHEVRLFFTQDLRINETDIGDTALFHPSSDSIIHYKGSCAFLFGGHTDEGGIFEYTTGVKAFKEHVGTWQDAEDGHLGKNSIAQGSVDSTFSIRLDLGANQSGSAEYWIVCGDGLDEVLMNRANWLGGDSTIRIGYARSFWQNWLRADPQIPADQHDLYERSLLLIRTQIDNGGAILAANDSDIMETNRATYSFLWPRDGALVSAVLDGARHPELSRRYFEMCHRILPKDRPMFLHKYAPDGTLGASWHSFLADGAAEVPFQEDESALTVWALERHFNSSGDLERIARWYPRLVREICDFMVEFRDPATGLPKPSWDLWEERRGIHAYTVATVIAGLRAGAILALSLGDNIAAARWSEGAAELCDASKRHLFDETRGTFHRMLRPDGSPDLTIDSATLAFGLFGCFPTDDPWIVATAKTVEDALTVRSGIGGLARYQGDYYFRQSEHFPGNPWVICTLWLAQTKAMQSKAIDDLKPAIDALQWVRHRSESTGVLAEQYHPETGAPLSVSPLTWSHAEVVRTIQMIRDRREQLSSTI